MKKNLLIAVLLLLTVSSVWAKDYNVETKKFKSWGEADMTAINSRHTPPHNWEPTTTTLNLQRKTLRAQSG
jgi:peptidoglycan hydrolase CwlO-like protein